MNQNINTILDFVKNKSKHPSFLIMYSLDIDNKIVIESVKKNVTGKNQFIFFCDFKNDYRPTEAELIKVAVECCNKK